MVTLLIRLRGRLITDDVWLYWLHLLIAFLPSGLRPRLTYLSGAITQRWPRLLRVTPQRPIFLSLSISRSKVHFLRRQLRKKT